VEVDSIPQQSQEKTAQIDGADLVIGLLAGFNQDGIKDLCEGLKTLPGSPRTVVLQGGTGGKDASANPQNPEGNSPVSLLPWSVVGPDPAGAPMQSISAACQSLFALTEKMGARACCLVASEMETATPQWVCQLLQPLLESDFDLVVPYYAPRKLQGLLNSSIIYPLTRCLYGKRIHNPLGPDVGVSRRLAQKVLGTNRNTGSGAGQTHPLASLAPVAACENMQICQVHVGARVYPPTDWMNMSSLVAQVLGSIFLEIERSAACWQRTRGSVSVPARGEFVFPGNMEFGAPAGNPVRTEEAFPLEAGAGQHARRIVGANRVRLRARPSPSNHQSRSPAPVDDASLSGLGGLLCAGTGNYRNTDSGTKNRAALARLRSGQAILHLSLAVA
jgi:hypothetical protein